MGKSALFHIFKVLMNIKRTGGVKFLDTSRRVSIGMRPQSATPGPIQTEPSRKPPPHRRGQRCDLRRDRRVFLARRRAHDRGDALRRRAKQMETPEIAPAHARGTPESHQRARDRAAGHAWVAPFSVVGGNNVCLVIVSNVYDRRRGMPRNAGPPVACMSETE